MNKFQTIKINYEQVLNKAQITAVKEFYGPMLCIAGAGSGKTGTLTYRVACMLENGIAPENILLLTFTRKAAENMLNRVAKLLGSEKINVAGGTYHGFAAKMLSIYGKYLNLNMPFSVLDEEDSAGVINLLRNELGLNKTELRFPNKSTLCKIFSKAANLELSVADTINNFYEHLSDYTEDIIKLHKYFNTYKSNNGLLDFDDLLLYFYKLLSEFKEIRDEICDKYKFVMADEYQDTNGLQGKITLLLAGEHQNIMVVGDDFQSIYSFRGAKIENILTFQNQFKNCKIIKLEQNYRSQPLIVETANKLMAKAKEGYKKKLFSLKDKGSAPILAKCGDEDQQARFVTAAITDLLNKGERLNEIAVLFRASHHAYAIETELNRVGISYVKWGGTKFLEASHLKDVMAYLKVINNPNDKVSWLRILLLSEGIGSVSASNIYSELIARECPYDLSEVKCSVKARKSVGELSEMLLRALNFKGEAPIKVIETVCDYYADILKANYDDYPRRLKEIDQFALIAEKYSSLHEFLTEITIEPPRVNSGSSTAPLILSTVHSAKGLEWKTVFVVSALEGLFPSKNAAKSLAEYEEERRLMYVAMTRAKENLIVSYPAYIYDHSSRSALTRVSPFVKEISDCMETWEISG
ncbi:MAG: ATP-dependent DNA helicase PcrA [bacterium ADurb.Bin157]|nr:MAG: ATP-dependent DNA helicase PcrA [bacterium ADurb.Bin157]